MKRIHWLLLSLCLSLSLSGQRNSDYGLFVGTSSYMGDINPGKLLYSPLPAGGIFYRYNFNPRQALRTNIFFGFLRAENNDRPALFKGTVYEGALQYEFNFFPYSTEGKRWNYTPFFAAGAGIVRYIPRSFSQGIESDTTVFVIPFSFGFKVNIYKNVGLEVEYGFRKTFYDNFDGLRDKVTPSDYAWIHNNDWYSFIGVAVTWKIYSRLVGCPAYSDVDAKRKR
ncbi:MAG: DUF6089 family protein [Bacteroidales bacterium]|nr:DUF6089 family protein [Bacteroidales bacterium]